jgi:hypothetical protein
VSTAVSDAIPNVRMIDAARGLAPLVSRYRDELAAGPDLPAPLAEALIDAGSRVRRQVLPSHSPRRRSGAHRQNRGRDAMCAGPVRRLVSKRRAIALGTRKKSMHGIWMLSVDGM